MPPSLIAGQRASSSVNRSRTGSVEQIGEEIQDSDVLGDHSTVRRERRHAGVRVDVEIFGLEVLTLRKHNADRLELRAGFLKSDMGDERACAR
jgi:hypothetical protein